MRAGPEISFQDLVEVGWFWMCVSALLSTVIYLPLWHVGAIPATKSRT
jgi:hypothetical protein